MRRLHNVLPDAFDAKEVVRTARAQLILRDWPEIVGKNLAKRSHPERVERGVVWIAVEGSAWAQELRMMREMILERLLERANDPNLFKDIRFGVRPVPLAEEKRPESATEVEDISQLTIREIADRRLARWKNDGPPHDPS